MSLDVGGGLEREDGLDADDFEKMYDILHKFVFDLDCGDVKGNIAELVEFVISSDGVSEDAKVKFLKRAGIFKQKFYDLKEDAGFRTNQIKLRAASGAYALRMQQESMDEQRSSDGE